MANYIEWSKGLANKREVVIMAACLKIDRHEAAGRVMAFWEWCDENVPEELIDSETGDAVIEMSPNRGDTEKFIDQVVCIKGFAKAMEKVGWIVHKRSSIVIPNYGRHNGSTAKTRNRNTRNQAKRRVPVVANLSPINGDKNATNGTERNVPKQIQSNDRGANEFDGSKNGTNPWEFEIPWMNANVDLEHLEDDAAICFIHRNCFRENPAAVGSSEAALARIFAAAKCALTAPKIKDRVSFFRSIVCNPSKDRLKKQHWDSAKFRITRHRELVAKGTYVSRPEFTPLCDEAGLCPST
jgi:hypothetical protein